MGIFSWFQPKNEVAAAKPKVRQVRNFDMASTQDRLFASWRADNATEDTYIARRALLIRARSRELCRTSDYAKKYLRMVHKNVVGPAGIGLQVKSADVKKDGTLVYDKVANTLIEKAWIRWWGSKLCSFTRQYNGRTILRLVAQAAPRDGEMFIVMVRESRGSTNPFRFSLKLLEADYLDLEHNEDLGGGAFIRMGIEFDADGRRVAFHFFTSHPGDLYRPRPQAVGEKVRVPAEDVLHFFLPERASACRGIAWFDTTGPTIKMLNGFEEATVVAARAGASKMGFFYTPDGTPPDSDEETDDGDFIQNAEPGQFGILPIGYDFKAYDPTQPTDKFGDFCKHQGRKISVGLDASYASLTGDLADVNYSSIRHGMLDERDTWADLQTTLIDEVLKPIFSRWLLAAFITGQIPLPISKLDKFDAPKFIPRTWGWVDPEKDANATNTELSNCTQTLAGSLADRGVDYDDHLAQLKKEKEDLEAIGITPAYAAKKSEGGSNNAGNSNQTNP